MSDREVSHSRSRSPSESPRKSASARRSRSASKSPRSKSRSRSYRRSRSRSHHRRDSRSRSRSRRRSRSRSGDRRRSSRYDDRYDGSSRRQSGSRSPMSSRRRHNGDRDHPRKSRCLGVFGLSLRTRESDLRDLFEPFGPIDSLQLIYDRQTHRSRGFGFIYFKYEEDAIEAKEKASGTNLDGYNIRIDYSITERPHSPTPGVYLGRTGGRYGQRSPSPRKRSSRYSRSRSRSRSYSRRRY